MFLFVGKTKESFIREGIDKYAGLIGRQVPLEVREIKGAPGRDRAAAVEKESGSVLARLGPGDTTVLLDERGRTFGSVEFAGVLRGLLDAGGRVVFTAGGPFGVSDSLRSRADLTLSLSRFTFTHEMARLILAEQVYRAITIMKGKVYHY